MICGFYIKVTVVDPFDGCHGSIKVLNASNGTVKSPGYDGFTTYEDDQSCYWLITAPPGMTITVKIHVRSNKFIIL